MPFRCRHRYSEGGAALRHWWHGCHVRFCLCKYKLIEFVVDGALSFARNVTLNMVTLLVTCCPRLQVSPMDVTKTRMQVMVQGISGPKPSLVKVMGDIFKAEGITGLYSGYVAGNANVPCASDNREMYAAH